MAGMTDRILQGLRNKEFFNIFWDKVSQVASDLDIF